jgi:hypothetical protein
MIYKILLTKKINLFWDNKIEVSILKLDIFLSTESNNYVY